MNLIYNSPNRGHHFKYAEAFYNRGMLKNFISGFSRFSPRADWGVLKEKTIHADLVQNFYLASLKFNFPKLISDEISYLSKCFIDYKSSKRLENTDVFLHYSGAGLYSYKNANKYNVLKIVEAVNSHVEIQESILKDEYSKCNIEWKPFYEKEKKRRVEEYLQADYILTPSSFVKQSFIDKGFEPNKILKAPFGFEQFNSNNLLIENKKDEFVILYVGSISIRKGLRYLIEAINNLKHRHLKVKVVGPMTQITGLNSMYISDQIEFVGVLKGDALKEAYMSSDLFCLPTLEEGLALVLGEALSFGLPIITTVNSGAQELITDEVEGFILPIQDSKAISDKIQLLMDDKSRYWLMRNAAISKSKKLNGWDSATNHMTKIISNLIT
ncbi:MAG: glycosyltransferase family 4 protein [Cytophagaceae bacterium]